MRIIGIDFTTGVVDRLRGRGFSISEILEDAHGFRAYFVNLEDPSQQFGGLEFHIVTDEEAYLKYHSRPNFHPFIKDIPKGAGAVTHSNTVFRLDSIVKDLAPLSHDLREYLMLKKGLEIPCVVLRCRDFEEFCLKARPDSFFKYGGRQAALIHLGPSCYDLLVI
jgi:hypothetical protein